MAAQQIKCFIGVDKSAVITMDPVVSTAGWTVEFNVRPTYDTAATFSKTTTGGAISVGGGSDNEVITVTISSATTSALSPGTYYWEARRTDAGNIDILAYGQFILDYPSATLATS